MTPFKINKKTYNLPSSWGDLTFRQFRDHKDHLETTAELVRFLLGCPEEIDPEAALPYLEWVRVPADLTQYDPSTALGDIKRMSFGNKIKAHQALKRDATIYGMPAVVKVYHPEVDTDALLLSELVPMYLEITTQLVHILNVERANLHVDPTSEQVLAGISEYEKLGDFNIIDTLALGKPWRYDEIAETEYIVIYNKLLKNKIDATFTRNYQRIMTPKK